MVCGHRQIAILELAEIKIHPGLYRGVSFCINSWEISEWNHVVVL